ncbi:MAG: Ig-like domain-containing protein [Acidobacteriota bacterium]
MNYPTSTRTVRTFIVSLLTYVLLTVQLAPLAMAANSVRPTGPSMPAGISDTTSSASQSKSVSSKPQDHQLPKPVAKPGAAPVPLAVNILATKTDNRTAAQPAAPGDTINYTVNIQNTGSTDATGVTFSDTIDPNTTLVPNSIVSTPLANNDTYNVIGNVRIQPNAAQGLLANDFNPDAGNNTGITASGPTTGPSNGQATVSADGSFTYNPNAGFSGTDTFSYTLTVTATGKLDTGTVTLTVGNGTATPGTNVIWFINPAAPNGGDGRLTTPFNCYTGPAASCFSTTAADDPGDSIFLFSGAHTGGNTLLNSQRLIGAGATDTLANLASVTVPTGSDALPATGVASPTITTALAATNAVNLGPGNLLRGFTVGNTTGAKIFGLNFGTLTVGNNTSPDVALGGSGQALNLTTGTFAITSGFASVATTSSATQGIVTAGVTGTVSFGSTTVSGSTTQGILIGTTTAAISFGNTTVTGGTDGVSFQNNSSGTRTFGTLGISGGSGNAFLSGAGGGNVTVTGAATLTSSGNPIEIQNMTSGSAISFAGTTVTKTTAGGAGVNWGGTNTGATLGFASLALTTSNGPSLVAAGGGTINVTTGSISATGSAGQAAPAISANGITFGATFTSVSSTTSSNAGNGISLTNVLGSLIMNGGSISGAAGDAFLVSGGTANITYNGTISTTTARPVNIASKTGGTVAFGGAVSSTSNGVSLTTNTGATINFTGGLSLSTAANIAFAATGGGTVSATQNNTTIVNTLTTTTGTALNVNSTTISASNLTFRSITSNGSGSNNGISLDTTGTIGGLIVTGNGAAASGGTISNKTGTDGQTTSGIGIYLNNTSNVSFARMQLNDCQNFVISGTTVKGFTITDSVISGTNGTNENIDEASVAFTNLTGSATITNVSVSGGIEDNFRVINNLDRTIVGNPLNRITFTNFTLGANSTAVGDNGLFLQAQLNAEIDATIQNSNLTSARGDLFQFDVTNTAKGDLIFLTNTVTNSHPAIVVGGGGVTLSGGGATNSNVTFTYDVNGNTFRDARGDALLVALQVGGGSFTGKIRNNTFGVAAVDQSGSREATDVEVRTVGSGNQTLLVDNNQIRQYGNFGILLQVGGQVANGNGSAGSMNATVTNNTINTPSSFVFIKNGFQLNSGTNAGDAFTVCLNLSSNTLGGSGQNGGNDFQLRNRFVTTDRLPGYAGANNDNAAVVAFIQGQNTGVETGNASNNVAGGSGGFIGGAGCSQPPIPNPADDSVRNRSDVLQSDSSSQPVAQQVVAHTTASAKPEVAKNWLNEDGTWIITEAAARGVIERVSTTQAAEVKTAAKTEARRESNHARIVRTGNKQSSTSLQTPDKGTQGPAPSVANFPITLGTLGAGKSVTITFSVTVNNPLVPPTTTSVSNQGTVSGTGFPNKVTDDPDTGAADDPTVTGIIGPPDMNVRDAKAAEPVSGTSTMLFTVALSSPAPGAVSANYATANGGGNPATGGTCAGGADYETTSGTVNFTAGQQLQTIPVTICSDATVEPDETFLLNLSGAVNANIVDGQAVGTITVNSPGNTLISELRLSGPSGANDEFVEVYNNTNSPLTVAASDASPGIGLFKMGAACTDTPVLVGTIPNGTVIPARGHYLFVGTTYSLGVYATGNQTFAAAIEDDRNLGFFTTTDSTNLSTTTRLDAVGFGTNTGSICSLLSEGTTLATANGSISQYSFVRKLATGTPQDVNDNAIDFAIVSTTPVTAVGTNAAPQLGAPGPENLTSPIQRNATVKASLIDPGAVSTSPPNRVRDTTPNSCTGGANCALGTLTIRRKFTNTTGAAVTRLRFRIVDITTATAPVGTADLRALTSTDVTVTLMGGGTTLVRGLTLEQPPNQPNGGGLNSSQAAGIVTVGTPIANGASINVQFVLGVQQAGSFRFFINVEALP